MVEFSISLRLLSPNMSSAPTTFFQTDPDDIFGLDIDRFPHPFTEVGEDHYDFYGDVTDECDSARTLVELRMCALSAAIREKPEWHVKFRDEKIRSTCQAEEVREQQKDLHQSLQLTDNMVCEANLDVPSLLP